MSRKLSPNMEMYLKTILHLEREGNAVRVGAITRALGITMPSVSQALRSLRKSGLVLHESYGTVRLSAKGRRAAEAIDERYEALQRFLTDVLGADERLANKEACDIEHVLSKDTLERLKAFLDLYDARPSGCKTGG
jgi:DtxR family Mn-dependent transcriptional regulator